MALSLARAVARPAARQLAVAPVRSFRPQLAVLPQQLRPRRLATEAAADAKPEPAVEAEPSKNIGARTTLTAEVSASKIFWAGFGWQGMSCVAGAQGLEATSVGFALMTGMGDFMGVATGHSLYYALKKMAVDGEIDMAAQVQTGIYLGTAAFMSGTAWQPVVNACQAIGLGFNPSLVITGAITGTCFFAGLRLGRMVYSKFFSAIPAPTPENLIADAQLSVSVGGATAAFVGTDVSYGDGNWLRGLVGVEDGMSDLTGMAKAGTSTVLGFTTLQMGQNFTVPAKKAWVD